MRISDASERAPTRGTCLVLCMLAASCDANGALRGDPDLVLSAPSLADALDTDVRSFGAVEGADALGEIVSARLSPDGSFIAALEASPPFLRIFRRDGAVESFVARGDGPGEIRAPLSLAVSDSEIAILEVGTRLVLVRHDGEPTATYVLASVLPQAIGRACGGWVLYGPDLNRSDRIPWLRTLELSDGDLRTSRILFRDSIMPAGRSWSRSRGPVAADGAVVFFHRHGEPPRIVRQPCDGSIPVDLSEPSDPVSPEDEPRTAPRGAVTLPRGMTILVGAFLDGRGTVVAAEWRVGSDSTWFRLSGDSRRVTLAVPGHHRIEDYRENVGALLSVEDPYPRLLLVDPAAFARAARGN